MTPCPACGHPAHTRLCFQYSCRCNFPRKKPAAPEVAKAGGFTMKEWRIATEAVTALHGVQFVSRLSLPHDPTCECGCEGAQEGGE